MMTSRISTPLRTLLILTLTLSVPLTASAQVPVEQLSFEEIEYLQALSELRATPRSTFSDILDRPDVNALKNDQAKQALVAKGLVSAGGALTETGYALADLIIAPDTTYYVFAEAQENKFVYQTYHQKGNNVIACNMKSTGSVSVSGLIPRENFLSILWRDIKLGNLTSSTIIDVKLSPLDSLLLKALSGLLNTVRISLGDDKGLLWEFDYDQIEAELADPATLRVVLEMNSEQQLDSLEKIMDRTQVTAGLASLCGRKLLGSSGAGDQQRWKFTDLGLNLVTMLFLPPARIKFSAAGHFGPVALHSTVDLLVGSNLLLAVTADRFDNSLAVCSLDFSKGLSAFSDFFKKYVALPEPDPDEDGVDPAPEFAEDENAEEGISPEILAEMEAAGEKADTNGDGKIDDWRADRNGDGTVDAWFEDSDHDGAADHRKYDLDGNGVFDQAFLFQDGVWTPTNVIEAFISVEFGRGVERPNAHNLTLTLNDHVFARILDCVPDGRYVYKVSPLWFGYADDSGPGRNVIHLGMEQLHAGHYSRSSSFQILFRLTEIAVPVIASSQEEANRIVAELPGVFARGTDIGVYSNRIAVYSGGKRLAAPRVEKTQKIEICADAFNMGFAEIKNAEYGFYEKDVAGNYALIGQVRQLNNLKPYGRAELKQEWTAGTPGWHRVFVRVDPDDKIEEVFEKSSAVPNNEAFVDVYVKGDETPPTVEIAELSGKPVVQGLTFTDDTVEIKGRAKDDYLVRKVEISVDGSIWTVATLDAAGGGWNFASARLDNGTHKLRARAMDNSEQFSAEAEAEFVIDAPRGTLVLTQVPGVSPPAWWKVRGEALFNKEIAGSDSWPTLSVPPGDCTFELCHYNGLDTVTFPETIRIEKGKRTELTAAILKVEHPASMSPPYRWRLTETRNGRVMIPDLQNTWPTLMVPPGSYKLAFQQGKDSQWVEIPGEVKVSAGGTASVAMLTSGVRLLPAHEGQEPIAAWGIIDAASGQAVQIANRTWDIQLVPPGNYNLSYRKYQIGAMVMLAGGVSVSPGSVVDVQLKLPAMKAISARIDPAKKEAAIVEKGGEGTQQAVKAGLEWLMRNQEADGHWDCRKFGGAAEYDGGVTALALLAFLGDGNTQESGPYSSVVDLGIGYLARNQSPEGRIGPSSGHYAYGHAIATLALVENYMLLESEDLRAALADPIGRAVHFIISAQHQTGGWGYYPGDRSDTSVTGWQVMALKSAQLVGFEVPEKVFGGVKSWITAVTSDDGNVGYRGKGGGSESLMCVGMYIQHLLSFEAQPGIGKKQVAGLLQKLPAKEKGLNLYFLYYGTLVAFHQDAQTWKTWNGAMKPYVLSLFVTTGDDTGSVPQSLDNYGGHGGRVYTTAMAVLNLEIYYRYR